MLLSITPYYARVRSITDLFRNLMKHQEQTPEVPRSRDRGIRDRVQVHSLPGSMQNASVSMGSQTARLR